MQPNLKRRLLCGDALGKGKPFLSTACDQQDTSIEELGLDPFGLKRNCTLHVLQGKSVVAGPQPEAREPVVSFGRSGVLRNELRHDRGRRLDVRFISQQLNEKCQGGSVILCCREQLSEFCYRAISIAGAKFENPQKLMDPGVVRAQRLPSLGCLESDFGQAELPGNLAGQFCKRWIIGDQCGCEVVFGRLAAVLPLPRESGQDQMGIEIDTRVARLLQRASRTAR